MDDFIPLHTFNYRHEADLAKSALQAEGIPAKVLSDDGGRQCISLQFVRGAQLLVRAEDAARAKRILKLDAPFLVR